MEGEPVMRNKREIDPSDAPALALLLSGQHSVEEARRLEAAWGDLELPPCPAVPEGFQADVLEALRQQQASEISWSDAPSWVRAAAGVTLALGMVVGLGVGQLPPIQTGPTQGAELDVSLDAYFVAEMESAPLSPAEAFWLELEEEEEAL